MRRQTWNFFLINLNLMERDRAAYIILHLLYPLWPPCPTDLPSRGKTTAPQPSCPPTLTVCASHLGDQAQIPQALWTLQAPVAFTYSALSLLQSHTFYSLLFVSTLSSFHTTHQEPPFSVSCMPFSAWTSLARSPINFKVQLNVVDL